MQSHEGAVTAYSHPGEGTTFHLYFPACESRVPPVEQPPQKPLPGSGERILLVDDEEALVKMGKKILERLGYGVDGQTKPEEALAAIEADPKKYDLVITDQMMPGMTGSNLAEKLHQLRPDLPVILNTGYTAALHSDQLQAFGIRKILLKPLSIETLAEAVRSVLKEASARRGSAAG
jgi:CheY-like chemotaxis protein